MALQIGDIVSAERPTGSEIAEGRIIDKWGRYVIILDHESGEKSTWFTDHVVKIV